MTATPAACAVCGDREPDEALLAECFACGSRYHLNPYNNRPGRDCGDAIIGPNLGVHYYCQRCLDQAVEAESLESSPADARLPDEHRTPSPPPAGLPPRSPRETPRRRYRRIDDR